ncbi:M16 family metallopeptidase [Occallatibacter riparius]|uniref:Insulinase family protein n=1 Tax=Occallatibacter riparius TaxID=1002689 RepID=A0A9J7BL74_9BACT|nr:pitrilysin family protein [Occallatibacter riparius]UWZ81638.1 insulinase family protein [Occallatibacter riparius]
MITRLFPRIWAGLAVLAIATPLALHAQDLKSFEQRITTKVLPNGLTILICERPEAPVFSYVTFVDAGDVNDPSGESGLAHMFEHLAFKGTTEIGTNDWPDEKVALEKVETAEQAVEAERRNPLGPDKQKLAQLEKSFDQAKADAEKYVEPNQFTEVAERNGAEGLNAETGLDQTEYYWSMPENRLELWAWLESSRLSETVPREFYKERDVVLEERRMRTDSNPIGRLLEQFLATAYVAHPYGRSGIGWTSEVSQITATEAMAFHKKYYVGSNLVVAVVGDVKAAEILPMLEKYFSKVPAGPKPPLMTTVEPKQFAEKTVFIREDTQPFYIEGYHRGSYKDPDDAVYDAISDIMSNGRVSRLYRGLVRDQQIAAEAQGFSPYPGDKFPGLFAFYAVPIPGHTPQEMATAIHKEIDKLKTTDVSDEELAMFKTRTRADLLRGLADNQGLANALAEYQTRYGDWRELFNQLEKVDKVTKADIRRVANKVFVSSNRTSAWIETATPTQPQQQQPAGEKGGAQ